MGFYVFIKSRNGNWVAKENRNISFQLN